MPPIIMAVIPMGPGSPKDRHPSLREIGGFPLVAWAIAAARKSRLVGKVIVLTDDRDHAEVAARYGAEAPLIHPPELSYNFIGCLQYFLEWLQGRGCPIPDYVVQLHPFCPNRDPEVIDQAIEAILADPAATSLVSAHPVDCPPKAYYRVNDGGEIVFRHGGENETPVMDDRGYLGNGYVEVFSVHALQKHRHPHGSRPRAFATPNPGDIHTETGFTEMDLKLHREPSVLRQYLEEVRARLSPECYGPYDEMLGRLPDLADTRQALRRAADAMVGCVRGGGKILAAGNGGSCSDALHFSGELLKAFVRGRPIGQATRALLADFPFGPDMAEALEEGIPVVVLGQNSALATAYLNDRRDARAYLAQECLALARPGDLLVSFSTSGESEALLWAMAAMKARGGRNIAFTGKGGGRMGAMADIEIRSPAASTPLVQEQHLPLYHALCIAVEAELFPPCEKR